MSYFPLFLKFDDKKILIIGGGKIAGDKLEHLLEFTKDITIISPQVSIYIDRMIEEHTLTYYQRDYKRGDCEEFDIVIVATDDPATQKEAREECNDRGILCNVVDMKEYCDFIFPSFIKKGDLTIAISTSGVSPAVAKHLRIFLETIIPDDIDQFLEDMKYYRAKMPKGEERMRFLEQKAKEFFREIR
jgi:precorrin-2 dehydrogenase/sirohydrochlorin ferrochelatase